MKLIYAYIKHYRNIFDQEICFSDCFTVEYNPCLFFPSALTIKLKNQSTASTIIYNESKLSDVHIIVGKTGAGKTNILQLIGMTEKERLYYAEPGDSYFLIWEDKGTFFLEPYDFQIDPNHWCLSL